jgi:hypothetical protein
MLLNDSVLFLILWAGIGFVALVTGVMGVSSLARQMSRTSGPSVRVSERKDALTV